MSTFTAAGWDRAQAALARALHDPAADSRRANLPYHMQPAHAAAVDGLPVGAGILEIGCGGGQCRPWFRARGHRYVGVDVSTERVDDWLREFGGPDLLCDAHFLPFADGSFDLVYSESVFQHLACPQLVAAEVLRVLKPGGLFCGGCAFMEPWHDASFFHLSPLGATQLLLLAGFEPVKLWPEAGWSVFRAVPAMAFVPGFRAAAAALGRASLSLYRLQLLLRSLRRRALHSAPKSAVLERWVVAGVSHWIARRPFVDEPSDPTVVVQPGVAAASRPTPLPIS